MCQDLNCTNQLNVVCATLDLSDVILGTPRRASPVYAFCKTRSHLTTDGYIEVVHHREIITKYIEEPSLGSK